MAVKWFLVSTKDPRITFEITRLDKATMRATLVGEVGVPFEKELTQETLAKYHYKIEKREVGAQECASI